MGSAGGHGESHGDVHGAEHAAPSAAGHGESSGGHEDAGHGNADPTPAASGGGSKNWVESLFGGIADFVTKSISLFVAFLFLLFAGGAIYGITVSMSNVPYKGLLLIAPAVFGLIAYKFKNLSIFLFIVVLAMIFLGV